MKKIIAFIAFIMFFVPIYVQAEIIPHTVYAISHKSVENEELCKNKELTFQSLGRYFISDTEYIEEDAIITVEITEYIKAKRGKRNAYLKVKIKEYTIPSEDNRIKNAERDNIQGTLRLSNESDKTELAKKAGVTVVGHILKVPGFSQAIAVSKGLLSPNPEQNRLQSAGTNLYESTPLTLTKKGNELFIEEDAIVVLRVKQNDCQEK